MAAEERSGNLYLYGCTAKLLRLFAADRFARLAVKRSLSENLGYT